MPIGIGLGTAIAGITAGGATVTAGVMASKAAGHAGDLNAHAASDQLRYLEAKDAQDQRNWEATQAENRRQFDSTQALNVDQYNKKEERLGPYRSIGAGATGTLADLLGIHMVPQPGGASVPPSSTSAPPSSAPPSSATPTASPSGSGDAAALKALLDSGVDPRQAVAQFNQRYGRTTGNEAVYYDPSQHGGIATIGLPDAYLAKPGGSWDITQRGGGGGSAAPASAASAAAADLRKPFTIMPGSTAPDLSALYSRPALLSAMRT